MTSNIELRDDGERLSTHTDRVYVLCRWLAQCISHFLVEWVHSVTVNVTMSNVSLHF